MSSQFASVMNTSSMFAMAFVNASMSFVDKNEKVLFKCVVCLGSLHHAPRILFYNTSKKELLYEKLIAYNDLQ